MEQFKSGEHAHGSCQTDHGPAPFVTDLPSEAKRNQNYRTAFWTGCHLQMTLMDIPPCGDIGAEVHSDTDQFIRVEAGQAVVQMGSCRERMDRRWRLCVGDGIFVPAGTWHNISNAGNAPLKLSSIYAPPHHPRGTVHCTKADAAHESH